MPLDEEGAKWSCEPCIRGHRSSKCQHFDRLMMKVPKAGRPLAKCPHPKGTCSCQKTYAVMVRIPKGSSCLCRPLYKVPMDANESTQSPPSSMASTSSPAGKVQKSGRRQSTMQVAPENIARALENMRENVKIEDGTPNLFSDFSSQSGLDGSYVSTQSQVDPSHREHTGKDSQPPQVSSCCSQKTKVPAQPVDPAPAQKGGSCCGGSRPSTTNQDVHSEADKQQAQQSTAWDDQTYAQFTTPQISSWQNPTNPSNGNYMHPTLPQTHPQPPLFHGGYVDMLPPQHQTSMSQNVISPSVASPSSLAYSSQMTGLGITDSSMGLYMPNNPEPFHIASPGSDPCHDCSCGEDCQCLGCAAHPFNTTTRKHVQEMGAMITSNGDEKNPEVFNPYQVSPYQAGTPSIPFNYFMQNTPMNHAFQPIPFDSYSDPNSTLPSGYSSPLSSNHQLNQQLMHPSEYYTLEYPVGLPSACSDVTGSCQCGSDCSCVGCLTHSGHNGLPLDVPSSEQPIENTAHQQNQISRHDSRASSATSHFSRIPVLENVSVPCLSPRTLETSMI